MPNPRTIISKESLLRLVTIGSTEFRKTKYHFEEIYFPGGIISSDIPIEFQDSEKQMDDEFNNRHTVSVGVIVLSVVQALIEINTPNQQNIAQFEGIKRLVFTNILGIRKKIILVNANKKNTFNTFYDEEKELLDNDINFISFSTRVNELAQEIRLYIKAGSEIPRTLNYFSLNMGQILPKINVAFDDEELGLITKATIKKISHSLQEYFFDEL